MRRRARHVLHLGVRRKLRASLCPRPRLRRANQRGTDPVASFIRIDIPPFDKRYAIGLATFRIGANREFDETCRGPSLIEGHEHFERIANPAGKIAIDLLPMFLC